VDLPEQKAFYDSKRQFQGKDSPGTVHPDSRTPKGPPMGQALFGVAFIVLIALMAWFTMRNADPTHSESHAPAPTAAPAKDAPTSPAAH
jgi:hypothetical protein